MNRVLSIRLKGKLLFKKRVGKRVAIPLRIGRPRTIPVPPPTPRYAINGFSFGPLDPSEFIELMTDRPVEERWAWRHRWSRYHPLYYPPIGMIPNLEKEQMMRK